MNTPTIAVTAQLGPHPEAAHLTLVVDVLELDGRFAYRARASHIDHSAPDEVDVTSGYDFADLNDALEAGETRLHAELMGS